MESLKKNVETSHRSRDLSPSQKRTYAYLRAEYLEITKGKNFRDIKDPAVLYQVKAKVEEMQEYLKHCREYEHRTVRKIRIDVSGFEDVEFVHNKKSKLIIKLKQNGKCFLIDENQNVISDEFDEISPYQSKVIGERVFIKAYNEETGAIYFELGKDKIIKARGQKWQEINGIFEINKDYFLDVAIGETDKKYIVNEKGERLAGPFNNMFSVQLGNQLYYYVWDVVDPKGPNNEHTIGDLYVLGQSEPIIRDVENGDVQGQCFFGTKDGKCFLMQSADNPNGYTEIEFEGAGFVGEIYFDDGSKCYRVERNGKEALFSDPQHQLSPWYDGMIYAVEKIFNDIYLYIYRQDQPCEFYSLKKGKLNTSELGENEKASIGFVKKSNGLYFISFDEELNNKYVYELTKDKLYGPFQGEIRRLTNINDELFFIIKDEQTEYISNLKGQKVSPDFDKIMEFEDNDEAPYIVGRQGDEIVKTAF